MLNRFIELDPFRTMDLMFDGLFPELSTPSRRVRSTRAPQELREHENEYIFELAMPGLAQEDLDVEVGENFVEVKARRSIDVPEGFELRRRERSGYEFQRRYQLPDRVDVEAVEAKLERGILNITLPKHASEKPRKIAIRPAA